MTWCGQVPKKISWLEMSAAGLAVVASRSARHASVQCETLVTIASPVLSGVAAPWLRRCGIPQWAAAELVAEDAKRAIAAGPGMTMMLLVISPGKGMLRRNSNVFASYTSISYPA